MRVIPTRNLLGSKTGNHPVKHEIRAWLALIVVFIFTGALQGQSAPGVGTIQGVLTVPLVTAKPIAGVSVLIVEAGSTGSP